MSPIIKILLIMVIQKIAANEVTNGTELVFAFMVHRHGDKTPESNFLKAVTKSINIEAAEVLITPWGFGQLTDEGKRRGYRTGQFIRRRYKELLSKIYNSSEIYVRSTDVTRTKMTALTAMAAVYPAIGNTWSSKIDWVPVPYTTENPKYDFNLFVTNCPVFIIAFTIKLFSPCPAMDKYKELLEKLTTLTGFDVTATPLLTFILNDIYVSLNSLGYPLSRDILGLMKELSNAAGDAMNILFGNNDYVAYECGPLLKEFFNASAAIIAGKNAERVRVYSAHDFNVFALEAITQISNKQGVPNYGSLYSLELRRIKKTGQYVVLPVYLATPEEPEIYLQVKGCGDDVFCDYDKFYNITAPYLLSESDWRSKCGSKEDLMTELKL